MIYIHTIQFTLCDHMKYLSEITLNRVYLRKNTWRKRNAQHRRYERSCDKNMNIHTNFQQKQLHMNQEFKKIKNLNKNLNIKINKIIHMNEIKHKYSSYENKIYMRIISYE